MKPETPADWLQLAAAVLALGLCTWMAYDLLRIDRLVADAEHAAGRHPAPGDVEGVLASAEQIKREGA